MFRKVSLFIVFIFITVSLTNRQETLAESAATDIVATIPEFGYGVSDAVPDGSRAQALDFNWVKTYGALREPQPVNVLARYDVSARDHDVLIYFKSRFTGFVQGNSDYIDAYEIGNEPNLYSEWGRTPNAGDYVDVLCIADSVIREHDPTAIVVTAGLATTGRIEGSWEWHQGHNGIVQDEREFLREMIEAHVDECTDVIGYHPMGFRADYNAEPDVDGGTEETDCSHGFCFRSAEKFREVMVDAGMGHKPIWGTETGWIVEPPTECTNDYSWYGRQWQIVSPTEQGANLVGAYQYARRNYPWMEALFTFNYNFNEADYYYPCEQMRFYSIAGMPAENWLRNMYKGAPLPPLPPQVYLPAVNSG